MSSSSSNQPTVLPSLNGTLSLPKIATTTTDTIARHLARIVAGNAGTSFTLVFTGEKQSIILENLRTHLEPMYNLLRPDDRLTLVRGQCVSPRPSSLSRLDRAIGKWLSESFPLPSHCHMCWKTRNRRVRTMELFSQFIHSRHFVRSAILGFDIDSNEITIGMTLPIWADLDIALDGDG